MVVYFYAVREQGSFVLLPQSREQGKSGASCFPAYELGRVSGWQERRTKDPYMIEERPPDDALYDCPHEGDLQ